AQYTFSFDPGKLTFSGSYIWKDQTYDSVFNRRYSLQPSYSQVNLQAVWNDAKGRYTVIAFCNNLFDSLGYDGAGGTLLAREVVGQTPDILYAYNLTAPRTFGVQFQYRWR
ncbi:MAG TPA: hypothetical protein VMU93_14225, partial [Caulobacteraceae bacterium]|nr:hypothetical protein [Caulobacteraceae bacterium]